VAHARVLVAACPLDRSGKCDVVEAVEERIEQHADLQTGEAGPEAKMVAMAEGHVGIRGATGVEAKGIREHLIITIGGRPPQGDLVAGTDRFVADLNVARGSAAVVRRRRGPAQDLLDSRRESRAVRWRRSASIAARARGETLGVTSLRMRR
jgi:hypothetical protein